MTEFKGTRGKWFLYSGKLRPQYPTRILEIQDESGAAIVKWSGFDCVDGRTKTETLSNAKLFAASKDLLEALQGVVASWDEMYAKTKHSEPHGPEMENIEFRQMQIAREAIAKALT